MQPGCSGAQFLRSHGSARVAGDTPGTMPTTQENLATSRLIGTDRPSVIASTILHKSRMIGSLAHDADDEVILKCYTKSKMPQGTILFPIEAREWG